MSDADKTPQTTVTRKPTPVTRSSSTIEWDEFEAIGAAFVEFIFSKGGVIVFLILVAFLGKGCIIDAHSPYHANSPGPACDTGGAQWATDNASVKCLTDRMLLTRGTGTTIGELHFRWVKVLWFSDLPFPANTSVEATIAPGSGCAGTLQREQSGGGAYGFYVCGSSTNSRAEIIRYDSKDGSPTVLDYKYITTGTTFIIKASCIGSTLSLSVNGNVVLVQTDTTYATTHDVGLAVSGYTLASATFSDFTFTPQ